MTENDGITEPEFNPLGKKKSKQTMNKTIFKLEMIVSAEL